MASNENLRVQLRPRTPKVKLKETCALSSTERSRIRRQRLKEDPVKWAKYLASEAARKRVERRRDQTDEQKARTRMLNKKRQERYRLKQKEKGVTLKPKPKPTGMVTRKEQEKKREYWKLKQREYREKRSSQKIRRCREKDKIYRRNLRSPSIVLTTTQNNTKKTENISEDAIRKAASRSKAKLPKRPETFARTIKYVLEKATPNKQEAVRRSGILWSPGAKKKLKFYEKAFDTLKNAVKETKCKREVVSAFKIMKKYKMQTSLSLALGVRAGFFSSFSENRAKRSDRTTEATKLKINFFYNCPTVATTIPDRKAVKDGVALKVIDRPLKDIYQEFVKQHPEEKVSFSNFAMNRPKHVNTTANQKWYSCLCEYCTNVDLKIRALNIFLNSKNYQELRIDNRYRAVDLTMCESGNFHHRRCIERNCPNCSTDNIITHLQPVLQSHGAEEIPYMAWEKVKSKNRRGKDVTRVMMAHKKESCQAMVIKLMDQLAPMAKHLFNARWQQSAFTKLIKNIPNNWVVINLDFAENYACVSQMEIQSAHWCHHQITIHPVVAYYKCTKCPEVVQEAILIVSDDLTHDAHAVQTFVKRTNDHLQTKRNLIIEHEVQFSDGCASQYKSHQPFSDISHAREDFGFDIERHYYGSRHGKGPCDGAGAVIKSSARRAVKGQRCVINNAKDLYDFAVKTLTIDDRMNSEDHLHSKRTIFCVTEEEILRNRPDRTAQTLKGTRSLHAVKSNGMSMQLQTRNLSCFCDTCLNISAGPCQNSEYVDNWNDVQLLRIGQIQQRGGARGRRGQQRGRGQQRPERGRGQQMDERGRRQKRGRGQQMGQRGRGQKRGRGQRRGMSPTELPEEGRREQEGGMLIRQEVEQTRRGQQRGIRMRGRGIRTRGGAMRKQGGACSFDTSDESDSSMSIVSDSEPSDCEPSDISMLADLSPEMPFVDDEEPFETLQVQDLLNLLQSPSTADAVIHSEYPNIQSVVKTVQSAELVIDSAEPIVQSAESVILSVESVIPSAEPVISSVESLVPSAEPVIQSVESDVSSVEPVVPSVEPVVPSVESDVSSVEPVVSSVESVIPSAEPVISSVESFVPSAKPVIPSVESVIPSVESVDPSAEAVVPSVEPVVQSVEPVILGAESDEQVILRVEPVVLSAEPNQATERIRNNMNNELTAKQTAEEACTQRKNYKVGDYVLVAHGINKYPGVVTDWPFIKFFTPCHGRLWMEGSVCHTVLEEDVIGLLSIPDIKLIGSRLFYSFKDMKDQ